jgi:hypothetical protein
MKFFSISRCIKTCEYTSYLKHCLVVFRWEPVSCLLFLDLKSANAAVYGSSLRREFLQVNLGQPEFVSAPQTGLFACNRNSIDNDRRHCAIAC